MHSALSVCLKYMKAKAHIHGQEDIPFANPSPNRASALEQSGVHEGSFYCVFWTYRMLRVRYVSFDSL